MYKPNRLQLEAQAERRRGVDLRLIVGFLVTSVRWLAESKYDLYPFIVEGRRSAETQARYYAQGRTTPGPRITNNPPGFSKHEKRPAEAIDIGFWDKNGNLNQDEEMLTEFYLLWRQHTTEFIWGGTWTNPHDAPHFQVS